MKRFLGFLVSVLLLASLFTLPAMAEDSIEFMTGTSIDSALYMQYQDMVAQFAAANPDAPAIELIPSSTDHEGEVKTRLAGGNAPDMWMTHGWSLGRYADYLTDLSAEEWATSVSLLLDGVMRGANGEIYALPLNVDIAGILYNADVLASVGYTADDIKTWDDFITCCRKLKDAGKTPIYNAGKDRWPTGLYVDWIAPGCFSQADLEGMLTGTFAQESYRKVLDMVNTFTTNGFFNADYSSATSDDIARALAQGETGFSFIMNFVLVTAFEYAPDAKLGFMQIPAFTAENQPYYVVGEKDAIGAWKDGANVDTCKAFLRFLAQPENVAALASASGQMSGLTNATSDLGSLQASVDKASAYAGVPYFDRVFMPSGAWDAIVSTTEMVVTQQQTVDVALAQIAADYQELKK
jgi:raffinose/stachyose/melibiose transport system substrate-binding protein